MKPLPRESKSLQAAIAAFLESAERRNCAELTRKSYKTVLDQFDEFARGTLKISSIDRSRLNAFLRSRNVGMSTKARIITLLKAFFSFCVRQEWIERSPAELLEVPRWEVAEREPYTIEEADAILRTCQTPHERALILLMRHTGLRVSDAVAFRVDQLREGCAWMRAKKNDRLVPIVLPSEVLAELRWIKQDCIVDSLVTPTTRTAGSEHSRKDGEAKTPAKLPDTICAGGATIEASTKNNWHKTGQKAERQGSQPCNSEWLFGNGQQPSLSAWHHTLDRIYRDSGVANAMNHRWRHTLASNLAAKGVPIRMIAKILGISEATAEKHYAKYTPEETEQLQAVLARVV